MLAHPDVDTVPYADRYALLAERLNLDFRSILFTLNHVPLCLQGARHAAQRSDVAKLIADAKGRVSAALPGIASKSLAPLEVPGEHDILTEVVWPCIDAVLLELVGAELGLTNDSLISRVFSQAMGIAKRRRLEQELAGLVVRMKTAFPDEDEQRIGSRVALAVLGRDALIGTLSMTLYDVFLQSDGQPLSQVPLTGVPTRTGVPYIDRVARHDGPVAGQDVNAGDALRCDLQSLEAFSDSERLRFFGKGAHLCLGRALSLELFGAISAHIAGVNSRVAVLDFALRDDDVFVMPKSFIVEVK